MSQDLATALSLPAADQVGFVVRDMDAALALYEPLFGEFTQMDAPVPGATFRGEEADCNLKIAFAKSGELEIELIQWVDGPCPHQEFIESGREGMHHLRFKVDNVEAKIEEAKALGYSAMWVKRMTPQIAWAYMERPGDPLIVEFLEMP